MSYTLTQTMSNGTIRMVNFDLPVIAGTYRVNCRLSDGNTINLGKIEINGTSNKSKYKLIVAMNDGTSYSGEFYGRYGLSLPELSEKNYYFDSATRIYYGTVKVKNTNEVTVNCLVWFKTNNSDVIRENGTFTLASGASKTIMFSDMYSEGLLARVHFVAYDQGINENVIFAQTSLGKYSGSYNFGKPEETTTTTTTTTTPTTTTSTTETMANLTEVESVGKFTLWRNQDAQ